MTKRRKDHDRRPGLYVHTEPIDATDARQLVHHRVESTAIHSKSQGWLPAMFLTLTHVPLLGPGEPQELKLMMRRSDVEPLIALMQKTLDAADWDAITGPVEGNPDA